MQFLQLTKKISECDNPYFLYEYVASEYDYKSWININIEHNEYYNKYNREVSNPLYRYMDINDIIQILEKKIKFYENAPKNKTKFTIYTNIKDHSVYSILKLSPDTTTKKTIETTNIINNKICSLYKINNIILEIYDINPWKLLYFTTFDQYIWFNTN